MRFFFATLHEIKVVSSTIHPPDGSALTRKGIEMQKLGTICCFRYERL